MKKLEFLSEYIIIALLVLTSSNPIWSMFRHVTPKVLSATTALVFQKRALCGNQANDPMWIKANQAISQFRKMHGIPEMNSTELQLIASKIEEYIDTYYNLHV